MYYCTVVLVLRSKKNKPKNPRWILLTLSTQQKDESHLQPVSLSWVTSLISEMSQSASPTSLKNRAVVRLVKTSGFASGVEGKGRFIKPVRRGAGGNPPWRGSSPCSWWDRFIFHILSDHRTSAVFVRTRNEWQLSAEQAGPWWGQPAGLDGHKSLLVESSEQEMNRYLENIWFFHYKYAWSSLCTCFSQAAC